MNNIEEQLFEALSKQRSEIANVLELRAVRGYKDSVVEKYSDQAHFIYELLQNADDVQATRARFILEPKRLIFIHNGLRHFSVSDPKNEENDSDNNTLGDINSITSIANSNKKDEETIGKFGVGFKAVFQYTSTPHIYDPNFRFKIERFIVPMKLDGDFPTRKDDETVFVFPFDHKERTAEEAYNDISNKLKGLSFPLLFLTNLREIEFEFDSCLGLYGKSLLKAINYGDTIAEQIVLMQNAGEEIYDETLWLFSRVDEHKRKYSVGFFLDKKGSLKPVNKPAFCFFPTKERTNLQFILHAPFLLTDSREGIRAGVSYNDEMISLLANLSADAIEHLRDIGINESKRLIDDNIVNIIPIDEDKFSDPSDKQQVSFLPFYKSIKKKFTTTELIPSISNYVMPENAYWADVPRLTQVFDNMQLQDIVENKEAQWVFTSLGRDEVSRGNKSLYNYISRIVRTNLGEKDIINDKENYHRKSNENIKGINANFIEKQDVSWLHKFYKWLSETDRRKDSILHKPVFLDQNNKAVAAFDQNNQLILFLPVKNIEGYTLVNEELLKNKNTEKFIKSIGVKEPSLRDQIYNVILPLYQNNGGIDTKPHFEKFFQYYCECPNDEVDDFIELIKNCAFLRYSTQDNDNIYRDKAASMYLPTEDLKVYFETKPDTRFITLDEYQTLVGPEKEKQKLLIKFLMDLGIKINVSIYNRQIDYSEAHQNKLPTLHSTQGHTWTEQIIDGCKEILEYIVERHDEAKSVVLWHVLLNIIKNKCNYRTTIDSLLRGKVTYFYYTLKYESFESFDAKKLKNYCWIKNNEGDFVAPCGLYKECLADIYDISSEYAEPLMKFLGIQEELPKDELDDEYEEDDDSNLTATQKEYIAFAKKLEARGIKDDDDLEELLEIKRQKDTMKRKAEQAQSSNIQEYNLDCSNAQSMSSGEQFIGNEEYDELDDTTGNEQPHESPRANKATKSVIKDIERRTKNKPSILSIYEPEEDDVDSDELMPSLVDYSKKIERAKEKSANEIDRITYFEELHNKAVQLTQESKYSLAWFQTLLKMESINSGEANSRSREVSISFAKVERELGTKRTLVLMHPNQYIPQFMEDLADIPLVLHMGDQTKTVAIEVANIKSYTLRVKMKSADDISGINLSSITSATINAKSPAFLLEELRKQFDEFEYEPEFSMKDNLCKNIEFVFGPPGTGKTTYIAQNILLPLMNNGKCKVLVLTPTNKAADVLVRRIMEVSNNDGSYEEWLVRFGATSDEDIEQSPVFREKTFDIRSLVKNVTVTTIARFPYDFFMPKGVRIFLNGINWDYVIIDEASMIPLANIVYPLYKKNPKKFIIAGDPFQIEPITSVDLWKDENIYKMVELKSFLKPVTKPHRYEVKLLTTQYRSIPDIGTIFSKFAYDGILKHYRKTTTQRPLNIGHDLGVETLNIIKFPVSKYESIYRCKRLQHSSSYQVYSALFTYEYVCYLSKAIADNNPEEQFKIGIIAPYRAQADMIDKLLAAEKMPKEIDVQVGTIHGFQGDECDIIFTVFNTPPSISSSKEMFLNKKNIINVSISRARDYLFIVMPDDNTENIDNLRLVKNVESLVHQTDSWNEFNSADLEDLMFDDPQYLENNAFSTSHQSVNVYGLPEKIYEVRTEENAVDVQIHKMSLSPSVIKVDRCSQQNSSKKSYRNSQDLDVTLIPTELCDKAIDLPVKGALNGWCYLVPYAGKLKTYTDKLMTRMFVPQTRNGQQKMISVSVIEKDRIIFISENMFKLYEEGLSQIEGIELSRTV